MGTANSGARGRKHPSWSGGLRSIKTIDQALDLPEQNQLDMKAWIKRNSKTNPTTGCWIWQRQLTGKGYPQINLKGTTNFAHRLSLALWKGKLDGAQALHKCDTPACVNPEHLFKGTHQDNMDDAKKKGKFKKNGTKLRRESHPNYRHGRYCK